MKFDEAFSALVDEVFNLDDFSANPPVEGKCFTSNRIDRSIAFPMANKSGVWTPVSMSSGTRIDVYDINNFNKLVDILADTAALDMVTAAIKVDLTNLMTFIADVWDWGNHAVRVI